MLTVPVVALDSPKFETTVKLSSSELVKLGCTSSSFRKLPAVSPDDEVFTPGLGLEDGSFDIS